MQDLKLVIFLFKKLRTIIFIIIIIIVLSAL